MREFLGKRRRVVAVVGSFWLATAAWAQGLIPPPAAPPAQSPVTISVDLSRNVAPLRPIYGWFGYDEANYTTTPLGRALLGELRDLSPLPVHIRVHHLLTSGSGKPELKFSSTNVYHEDGEGHPAYDFTILDGIFDAYSAESIRPVVELGFMPKDLAANLPDRPEQPYEVHFPHDPTSGASNNPPKDYRKWGELVRAVTAHLVHRYGRAAARQWYFEVWNEPDIGYWHGSQADYFRLYDYAVAGVRAALPTAQVGGPATTGPSDAHAAAFLQAFLDHVKNGKSAATGAKVPLDFISFHAKGQPTIADGHVTMGLARELTDVDRGFSIIESFPMFRHLPVILSEADPEGCAACSSRMNPANNYRNGTLYPAYTATAFKGLLDLAREHQTNLIAMLSWSFEFENEDYFEGFRSLSTNGIDKPILNFFRMLGLMGGERTAVTSSASVPLPTLVKTGVRAAPDVDALATHEGRQAAVLVWNYHDAAVPGVAATASTVNVMVKGIPAGVRRVLVQNYRIDDRHSNAYTAWQAMGSPQQPTTEQYARLKADEGLQLIGSPTWAEVKMGTIEVKTIMPRQSVSLLSLRW
jgi:xylan 1,4-beta-xylosidase